MFSVSHLRPHAARSFFLFAVMTGAACGDAGGPQIEITDPEEYLDELPAYPEPPEAFDRATGGAKSLANGVQPEVSHWHVDHGTSSITYDPNHARVYLTGDFGGGRILAAYNPNADPLNIPFYSELADPASYPAPVFVTPTAAAHDPTRDLIYVSITVA